QKGDLEGAIQAFEKSLEFNPESRETYYGLGQALKHFRARANRSRGGGASEFLKAGNEALARGDFSAARGAAEKAVTADAGSAEAHHLLGFALWYAGGRTK